MIFYAWKYGTKFEKSVIINIYKSYMWNKRFYENSDFEIYIPATAKMLSDLKKCMILTRDDDNTIMLIEKISISEDVENGDFIIISGRSFDYILQRRILAGNTTFTGSVSMSFLQMLHDNVTAPSDTSRTINCIGIGNNASVSDIITLQPNGENVNDWLINLKKEFGLGIKTEFSTDYTKINLSLTKGVNRTYAQTNYSPVIFSRNFCNMLSLGYSYDLSKKVTSAIVAGEGEGTARKKITVKKPANVSGLNLCEIFVDARDISSDDGEISLSTYYAMLSRRGCEKIAEQTQAENTIEYQTLNLNFTYLTDYFVGDIVEIETTYDMKMKARITEMCESDDENGQTLTPTFEEWSEE